MSYSKSKKEIDFFREFERFIKDSLTGRRRQPNGKKISSGTIANYRFTLSLIRRFCEGRKFPLRLRLIKWLTKREFETERKYWKRFYHSFTTFLYENCGLYDNYTGQNIKIIRVFFNYLNRERSLEVGEFHKQFYVWQEDIAIYPLMPEELNFLIYNEQFEDSLNPRMRQIKDYFVFGCTVALRFSDLKSLKQNHLRTAGDKYYLKVKSIKTSTDTLIRLPGYAVEILNRNKRGRGFLLPQYTLTYFNKRIKGLLANAGFTQPVLVTRNKRGKPVELKNENPERQFFRFCDVASSHTMRRTAITTMLSLGVPDQVVRKISGHAPNSKEFYRYVFWSQLYQDGATEQMFQQLKDKVMKVSPVIDH
jgi:site-specific recombinase XerD